MLFLLFAQWGKLREYDFFSKFYQYVGSDFRAFIMAYRNKVISTLHTISSILVSDIPQMVVVNTTIVHRLNHSFLHKLPIHGKGSANV